MLESSIALSDEGCASTSSSSCASEIDNRMRSNPSAIDFRLRQVADKLGEALSAASRAQHIAQWRYSVPQASAKAQVGAVSPMRASPSVTPRERAYLGWLEERSIAQGLGFLDEMLHPSHAPENLQQLTHLVYAPGALEAPSVPARASPSRVCLPVSSRVPSPGLALRHSAPSLER